MYSETFEVLPPQVQTLTRGEPIIYVVVECLIKIYVVLLFFVLFSLHYTSIWRHVMHGDVIKWKHFPPYWPFVRGIHRGPVNSPHKGQWRGALMFHLICVWINGWGNNREAGDLIRSRAHYDVIVMKCMHAVIHWGRYKMAAIFHTFPDVFSENHCRSQHCFRE